MSESSLEASEVSISSSVNTSKLLSEVKEQLSKLKIGGAEDCAGKSPVADKRAGRDMPPLIDLTGCCCAMAGQTICGEPLGTKST